MRKNIKIKSNGLVEKVLDFIRETDIHVLVFTPPIVGFGGLFLWLFVMVKLTNGNVPQSHSYIAIGLAGLITSFSGFAEIYKKEMPGPFGQIVKGVSAIIPGAFILLFGLVGIVLLIYGLKILLFGN